VLVCGVYVRWIREKVIVAYSQIIFRHLKNVQGGARNVIPLIVQGPHSEVVPRAFWRLVSKSCDECKGSFARGCEAKRWSHWTCSSLGTIFHPMRINSVPDVKCFLIIKMCYVHNQWYGISCATLYDISCATLYMSGKRL